MPTYREAALNYVRHVLSQERDTPSSLAKRVGISSTTLTRPLNSDDHKYTISMATLEKIKNETGYDPAPFFAKDLNYLERTLDFYSSEEYERVQDQSAAADDRLQFQRPIGLADRARESPGRKIGRELPRQPRNRARANRRHARLTNSATDIWYFMRALDHPTEPTDRPTDEGILTKKPHTQYVGCRLCT